MAESGVFHEGSELSQLIAEGLLQPAQFVGVERNQAGHEANLRAARLQPSSEQPIFYQGDIIDALHAAHYSGKLAADVVNLDTTSEAQTAVPLLARALNILNHIDGPTMVAWNVITGRFWPRHRGHPWDATDHDTRGHAAGYLRDLLLQNSLFRESYRHGWDMFPEGAPSFRACRYDGAHANSKTQMTMYVFVRRRRACGEDCGC